MDRTTVQCTSNTMYSIKKYDGKARVVMLTRLTTVETSVICSYFDATVTAVKARPLVSFRL